MAFTFFSVALAINLPSIYKWYSLEIRDTRHSFISRRYSIVLLGTHPLGAITHFIVSILLIYFALGLRMNKEQFFHMETNPIHIRTKHLGLINEDHCSSFFFASQQEIIVPGAPLHPAAETLCTVFAAAKFRC